MEGIGPGRVRMDKSLHELEKLVIIITKRKLKKKLTLLRIIPPKLWAINIIGRCVD